MAGWVGGWVCPRARAVCVRGYQGGAVGVEELGAEGAEGAVGPLASATSLGEKRPNDWPNSANLPQDSLRGEAAA